MLLAFSCLCQVASYHNFMLLFQDHSITMLRKVLRQIDIIKSSRSGTPNFEAHEVEANDLQAAVVQYLQFRGTGKVLRLLLLLKLEFEQ